MIVMLAANIEQFSLCLVDFLPSILKNHEIKMMRGAPMPTETYTKNIDLATAIQLIRRAEPKNDDLCVFYLYLSQARVLALTTPYVC